VGDFAVQVVDAGGSVHGSLGEGRPKGADRGDQAVDTSSRSSSAREEVPQPPPVTAMFGGENMASLSANHPETKAFLSPKRRSEPFDLCAE
jgi:hypothetical protein